MRDKLELTMGEVIKQIGLIKFIRSRIVTPRQIKEAKEDYEWLKGAKPSEVIFYTRYHEFKAIEGYDFHVKDQIDN